MNETKSRRVFLKQSTGILTTAALGANLSLARAAHAQSSDEIKVGLIGCGNRGSGAVSDCLKADPNTKLVAVADAFEDSTRKALKQLNKRFADARLDVPDDRIFVGFDAYQKVIDSGVDLVVIATPPGFRPMHYRAAVEANKHVFMEKPCCVDAAGYRSLVATNQMADKKRLKVGVGLQRHHQKPYLEIVKRLQDGAIGDIQTFRVYWNANGVWNRKRKPGQTEMEYQMRNWYYFVWLSGDHIVEQHVHNIDVANWIKGELPVEAQGMGGRQVRRFGPQGDFGHIFDHHSVEFTYADGTKMLSQCRHIPSCWRNVSENAQGTKGSAECNGRVFAICDGKGKRTYRFRGKTSSPYVQEHIDLIDAIRNDKDYNEGPTGAAASFSAVLGRMATYSGNVVKWGEAAAKGPSVMPAQFAWNANPPVMPDENGSYEHAVAMPGHYKPY